MNLIGEGFHPNIITEINRRQKIQGYRASSNSTTLVPQVLDYLFSRTGWVKMISSVDIINYDKINSPGIKSLGKNNVNGSLLAKNFILFNGVGKLKDYNSRGGVATSLNVLTNTAYGLGGTYNYGQSPMMGITSANVKTETMGSLKTATIQIKAFNKVQFDIIDNLYMRLGYNVLLEWGYSHYFQDNGLNGLRENIFSLEDEYFKGTNNYYSLLDKAIELRYKSYGNYDAIIGRVVNFSWTFNTDGSYDITVILRSQGDVIEALKTNTLLDTKPPTNETLQAQADDLKNRFAENLAESEDLNNRVNHIPTSTPSTPSDKPIDQTTELGKLYVQCKQALDNIKTVTNGSVVTKFNNLDILKQLFQSNTTVVTSYYIRLGSLFQP